MRKWDRSRAATESAPESDWRTFTLVGVALAVTQMSYYLTRRLYRCICVTWAPPPVALDS